MDNKPIYKTAEELGIKQWEHDGLVALIGPLSRNALAFDMENSHHTCSTACCIGGWVDRNHGEKTWGESGSSIRSAIDFGALHALYYQYQGQPKAPQAARAIVNFLVTGSPQWDAVMAGC